MYYYAVFREVKTYKLEIRRLNITKSLQDELDTHFFGLAREWSGADLRRLPLERDWVLKDGEELWTTPFSFPSPFDAVLDHPNRYPDYQPPHDSKVIALRALLAADRDNKRLYFQSCNQSHMLGRGLFAIIFDQSTFAKLTQPGLNISNNLAAVVADGELEFSKPGLVSQFIDLKWDSYGEATVEEIKDILDKKDVFSGDIDNEAIAKMCDKTTRKHFQKVIKDEIMMHSNMTGEGLAKLAEEAGLGLETQGKKGRRRIVLPKDKVKMKSLVMLLNQKVFRSVITNDFCETNSYRKLKKPS